MLNPLIIEFQEDVIKIAPGYGIATEFIAGLQIGAAVNYRYYEE